MTQYPDTTEAQASQDEQRGGLAKPKPTAAARLQLAALEELKAGWNDESPVPNKDSLWFATRIMDVLDAACLTPSSVVPDAEGGVSIYFSQDATKRYASLSCSNEGDVVGLTHDRTGAPVVWNVGTDLASIRAAVDRIRTFIVS